MEFHSDAHRSYGKTEPKSGEFPHSYGKTKRENFVPWEGVHALPALRRIFADHSTATRAKYARATKRVESGTDAESDNATRKSECCSNWGIRNGRAQTPGNLHYHNKSSI